MMQGSRALMIIGNVLVLLLGMPWSIQAAAPGSKPVPVSPGSIGRATPIQSACPTFSWDAVSGARGHELAVYSVAGETAVTSQGETDDRARDLEEVLRIEVPGQATTWTPPLGRCLERGRLYAWSVRARGVDGWTDWSDSSILEVAEIPTVREVEEALWVLRIFLREHGADGEVLSDGKTAALAAYEKTEGVGASDNEQKSIERKQGGADFIVDGSGNVTTTSVSGDGSALTNLDPSSLVAGTAGINITGTSGNVTGTVAIANGGTGATTASAARANLAAAPASGSSNYVDTTGDTMTGGLAFNDAANMISSSGTNLSIAAEEGSNSDLQLCANDLVEIDANDDIVLDADNNIEMFVGVGDSVMVNGAIVHNSNRRLKENLRTVQPRNVLEKLVELPVTYWNFKNDPDQTMHVGPMAQDFHTAFGVGDQPEFISTVDADGVTMAAIKGLHELLREKVRELEEMRLQSEQQIETLGQRLEVLERVLENR